MYYIDTDSGTVTEHQHHEMVRRIGYYRKVGLSFTVREVIGGRERVVTSYVGH